jgi:dTDP-4-amino-4,6-dideoxygalactose transaminase
MESQLIPFNKPYFPKETLQYIGNVIDSGFSKGDGRYTEKSSELISELSGGGDVLMTPSCTHALEMAALLLDLKPGDEVIMPSYTFTSAATSLVHFGVTPVFVDIDARTKNIDCDEVSKAISSRTRAISFVNYAGVGADFHRLRSLANENGVALIEDNAHGLGGTRGGQILGSVGDLATLSFHESKNFQCGEGGALVINNPIYSARARVLREKGTNRSQFIKGEVQKYQWVDKGSSYLLSDILAAILLPQLERFSEIQNDRLDTWSSFENGLSDWANENGVQLQYVPEDAKHTAHMFYIEFNGEKSRAFAIGELHSKGISSVFHYQGLHNSPAGRTYGSKVGNLENTNRVESTILRIPIYFGMSQSEIFRVIDGLLGIRL